MAASVEETLVVRMEATLTRFENQMRKAQKVTNDSANAMEKRMASANAKMAASSERAAAGISRVMQVSGAGRFVLQNTANQIGDIAVQMGSGTSASRALGQQLPQLLGGFGALGGSLGLVAPLLGTVAALGIPLGIALATAGQGAQDAGKAIENLEKAVNEYMAAASAAGETTEELQEKFGSQAAEIRETLALLREISLAKALDGLKVAVESIDVSRLAFLVGLFQQGPGEIQAFSDNYNSALQQLREQLNLSGEDAVRLLDAINALNSSAGPEQVVASARALNALMLEVYGSTAVRPSCATWRSGWPRRTLPQAGSSAAWRAYRALQAARWRPPRS